MTPQDANRLRDMGRYGGCGEIAAKFIERFGGTPLLRYDATGCAVHAAVEYYHGDGDPIHFGDNDDDLVPVSMDEFNRARKEDFCPGDEIQSEDDWELIDEWLDNMAEEIDA